MKHLSLILLLFTICHLQAQVAVKKSSLSTGGGSATVGSTSIHYAIGEVAINEQSVGQQAVSEGFIGPDLIHSLGIENYGTLTGVEIFPNPVKTEFQIRWQQNGDYQLFLYDLNGKLLYENHIKDTVEQSVNISQLRRAVYMLVIIDRKNRTYTNKKIQKL